MKHHRLHCELFFPVLYSNVCFSLPVAKCKPQEQQRWTHAQVRPLHILKNPIATWSIIWRAYLTNCITFFFTWCRFVRRLLYFYKPSSKLYAGLALDHAKARQLTVVGCQFIEFLMDSDEVRETCTKSQTLYSCFTFCHFLICHFFLSSLLPSSSSCHQDGQGYLEELVKDMVSWLSSSSGLKPERCLQSNGLLTTLSQHYFLFLGTLSAHPQGVKLLEKCGLFQWWVNTKTCSRPREFK